MKTIEVEAFADQHNYAVIRLPERKFPGFRVQGDSLSILIANLQRGCDELQSGDTERCIGWLRLALDTLQAAQRQYEAVLAEHSIPLPY